MLLTLRGENDTYRLRTWGHLGSPPTAGPMFTPSLRPQYRHRVQGQVPSLLNVREVPGGPGQGMERIPTYPDVHPQAGEAEDANALPHYLANSLEMLLESGKYHHRVLCQSFLGRILGKPFHFENLRDGPLN